MILVPALHLFIYPFMISVEGSPSWTLDQGSNQAFVLVNSMCPDMLLSIRRLYIPLLFLFLRWSFALVAQAGMQWRDQLTATSASRVQAILLLQPPPRIWDYRHAPPCPANFLYFFVETGFRHVDQDGLNLLTS